MAQYNGPQIYICIFPKVLHAHHLRNCIDNNASEFFIYKNVKKLMALPGSSSAP